MREVWSFLQELAFNLQKARCLGTHLPGCELTLPETAAISFHSGLFIAVFFFLDESVPQGSGTALQPAQGRSEAMLQGGEMKRVLSLNQSSGETSSLGCRAGRTARAEAVVLQLCCYSTGAKMLRAR